MKKNSGYGLIFLKFSQLVQKLPSDESVEILQVNQSDGQLVNLKCFSTIIDNIWLYLTKDMLILLLLLNFLRPVFVIRQITGHLSSIFLKVNFYKDLLL